jgi:hypothetical protein
MVFPVSGAWHRLLVHSHSQLNSASQRWLRIKDVRTGTRIAGAAA